MISTKFCNVSCCPKNERIGLYGRQHHLDDHSPPIRIWNLKLPYMVGVFLWRVLKHRLSSKDNLVRRRILSPGGYFEIKRGYPHAKFTISYKGWYE
ncbi:hypothetical protein AAZX31_04G041900 [Glycine max]|uniref:Uncharacterized protein n=1 Tax=Glycine max TaxID=3847 RepID=K7KI14_SOYBN|nr:hypothetical protein JHK87_008898 [Glycine soja]KAH1109727.1 hypothetical protein GYH30_008901 [Glycine max]KRH61360.1 hypothetical protein GLYMA_04G043000v4 [Glycine max]